MGQTARKLMHTMVDELLNELQRAGKGGGEHTAVFMPDADGALMEVRVRILLTPINSDGERLITHINEYGKDIELDTPELPRAH